jgi:predicted dehydrogenase
VPEQVLRAGVIGCGLGANHGYAYTQAPEYELVAVCDLKPEVLGSFFERARIARGAVHDYTDYRAMLEKERLDVVSVATPDDYHVDPVCDASDAGVRGIFCEKPLAIRLQDADRMIATVERNGTKMSVDHTRSWLPLYQAAHRAVRDGEIGELTRIVAHMGGRRSMLFRNGTHLVDAVCYFAAADPVWVIAAHEQGFEAYGTAYHGEGGKDPMLDPASTIIIEFANGVRCLFNSAKGMPAGIELDLQGPNGRFRLNDKECVGWKTSEPGGTAVEAPAPQGSSYGDYFGDNLIRPVQELAQMIREGAPSSSPPRRARNVLEIMLGALLSQTRDSAKVHLPLPRA